MNWLSKRLRRRAVQKPPFIDSSSEGIAKDIACLEREANTEIFYYKLNNIVGLPTPHFDSLYKIPVQQLLLRLHHLPFHADGDGDSIECKLKAIEHGMKIREGLVMPENVDPEDINARKDVWRYATFVTLLVYKIDASLISNKITVTLRDQDEHDWNPFSRPLVVGTHFRCSASHRASRLASPLWIPMLIPPNGLGWLMNEENCLDSCIEAINNPSVDTALGRILTAAYRLNARVQESPSAQANLDPNSEYGSEALTASNATKRNTFNRVETPPPILDGVGQAFLSWLNQSIASSKISNTSEEPLIFRQDDFLCLVSPNIFVAYAASNNCDAGDVETAVINMGLHQMNGEEDYHCQPLSPGVELRFLKLNAPVELLPS